MDRTFTPDPAKAQLADRRFALWCDLITRTRSINATLAG
jgi:hypothetical protein